MSVVVVVVAAAAAVCVGWGCGCCGGGGAPRANGVDVVLLGGLDHACNISACEVWVHGLLALLCVVATCLLVLHHWERAVEPCDPRGVEWLDGQRGSV